MKAATGAQMRQIEELANQHGYRYEDMMERAGRTAANWIREECLPGLAASRITIVCGKGNNGGDGYVIARHLAASASVTLIRAQGPAATAIGSLNERMLPAAVNVLDYQEEPYLCSAAIGDAALLVDCVYGVGFHGPFSAEIAPLIQRMNKATGYKVAVDMPSGVPADGSAAEPDAFLPDVTLTFTAVKVGLDAGVAGAIRVLDIGIASDIVEQVLGERSITPELVRSCLTPRLADSHKGTYGRLLTVCGSYGMAGAALLCARGALRSGVGLLTAAVPHSLYPIMAPVLPEAVFAPLPETEEGTFAADAEEAILNRAATADAVVLGCGIGTHEQTQSLVRSLRHRLCCPLILDADGINAVSAHTLLEETASSPLILTPHPGEMARLLEISVTQVQQNRAQIARRFADEFHAVLVLKGHRTLVAAPGRPLLVNETGNPGMATGGSGDVLAGIIGSLVAQGMDPYYAAVCGVYLHGAAGDRAAERLSQHSMLPSDIIEELGGLFLNFEK
ncbi:MAG: NAD(P)H-hydrate dehydratase [Ruminococcaceae bacterium]|nr:NAD(P)H-hydrate dehydratase [Oscillospiraceae bacterium]